MHKLASLWGRYRLRIIIGILIFVFIIMLIITINQLLHTQDVTDTNTIVIKDTSKPSESVISGTSVSDEITENNVEIFKEFVEYCNSKNYQSAYNLLTDDCKEELFPDVQTFTSNYCEEVFDEPKTFNMELWYQYTDAYVYRVTYKTDNILETGIINSGSNIEDYVTIIETDNDYKLNISNFIDKVELNNETEVQGIKISIKERIRYKNYERYLVEIQNNTANSILLGEENSYNDICLIDSNGAEYDYMVNDSSLMELEIQPYSKKTVYLSFNKMLNTYRIVDNMRFKNIITNAEEYKVNKENTQRIVIDIAV